MNKEDINTQVQQLHEEGYSIREIAKQTGISKSSVGRMVQQLQQPVGGTRPNAAVGTFSNAVPKMGWDTTGTQESRAHSDENTASHLQSGAQERVLSYERLLFMSFYKDSLQSSYRSFLESVDTFLDNNLVSEELALSLIKSRQGRVGEFISRARSRCSDCGVDYEELFMAYVLERLYSFFGQEAELVRISYEYRIDEIKIKECPSIQLLLKQASRSEVFAPVQDYVGFFPDVSTLSH